VFQQPIETMTDVDTSLIPRLRMRDAIRLFGLSARALRFYEEKGLIRAYRDTANYRWYDAKARRRLAWIASLRSAGISLRDIRVVLAAEETHGAGRASALGKLQAMRDHLEREIGQVNQLYETLHNLPDVDAPPWSRAGKGLEDHSQAVAPNAPPLFALRRANVG
jgi:DNA-binding transcriptional MerR regulator